MGEVTRALPCSFGKRKAIADNLRERIEEEISDDELTMAFLLEKFGTPDEVARGFGQTSLGESFLKKAKKSKIMIAIISAVLILIIGLLIFVLINTIEVNNSSTYISDVQEVCSSMNMLFQTKLF